MFLVVLFICVLTIFTAWLCMSKTRVLREVKQVKIRNWRGRLGNNLIQMRNALLLAVENGYQLSIPEHEFFNVTIFHMGAISPATPSLLVTHDDEFFGINPEINEKHAQEVVQAMRAAFDIKSGPTREGILVHIRSGDLFTHPQFIPDGYVPPPLKYYSDIIHGAASVTILAEDTTNPCVDGIMLAFPQCTLVHGESLASDIELIMSHKTLVASYGTFIPALAMLSTVVDTLHVPVYEKSRAWESFAKWTNGKVTVVPSFLENYKNLMGPFIASTEQKQYMLSYDEGKGGERKP